MPTHIVSNIICSSLTFVLIMQHTPDLSAISDTICLAQTEVNATAEHTAQALNVTKSELKNTIELVQQSAANIQQNSNTAEEARAAAKDATEVGKATRMRERLGTRDYKSRRTDL